MPPTILVFDSGLGGLTVLREIVKARPDAHYVYVADDAFFPYGHHSEDAIITRVVPLIGELIDTHRPDLVVIACNTASTLVMSYLRDAYTVPFVGTVPAIKPACASSRTRRVSVLGTRGTVKREYTRALIRDFSLGCEVTLVGSPDLASLAESALSGVEVGDAAISAELAPCFVGAGDDVLNRTDTVVLACTHYPLLLDRFVALAPWPVDWIDPAPAIARRVSDLLGAIGLNGGGREGARREADQAGAEMIFTSGRPHTLSRALMPFFGGPRSGLRTRDRFDGALFARDIAASFEGIKRQSGFARFCFFPDAASVAPQGENHDQENSARTDCRGLRFRRGHLVGECLGAGH